MENKDIMGCLYVYSPEFESDSKIRIYENIRQSDAGGRDGNVYLHWGENCYKLFISGELDMKRASELFEEYFTDILKHTIYAAKCAIVQARDEYNAANTAFTRAIHECEINALMAKADDM